MDLQFKNVSPRNLCMSPNICHFCKKNESHYHHFLTNRYGWIYCGDCAECADYNLHHYCRENKRITYNTFANLDIDFLEKIEDVKFSIIRSSGEINHDWKIAVTLDDTFISYDEKKGEYLWEMSNGHLRKRIPIRKMKILNDHLDVDRILREIEKYHNKIS